MIGAWHKVALAITLGCAALGACTAAQSEHARSLPKALEMTCDQSTASVVGGTGTAPHPAAPQPTNLLGKPLIAAITAAPATTLLVYDLEAGRVRWSTAVDANARPQILADMVVTTQGPAMLAFDLGTGARRWAASFDRPVWLGASQAGALVVFTTTTPTRDPAQRGSTLVAIDALRGTKAWQRTFAQAISRPSCTADRCYVLADHHEVLMLDARSGATLNCTTRRQTELEWVDASDRAGLLLGESAPRAALAAAPQRVADQASLPDTELPGQVLFRPSSYVPIPAARSAHGRIALLGPLLPGPNGARLAGDRYYSVFYRDLFAHAADGRFVWARLLPSDVVAAAADAAGLVVVTEDGAVSRFDADSGAQRQTGSLGAAISSADLDTTQAAPVPSAAQTGTDLRRSLTEIALDPDMRTLPARALAIEALLAAPEAAATADLLSIYQHDSTPPALRERVVAGLPKRSVGTEYLVDALLSRYDFLDDSRPPPLAAIVPALVAQKQERALPLLLDCLFDPNTTLADLGLLVDAIARLGGAQACAPLGQFLSLYHADSAFAQDATALALAARAVASCADQEASTLPARIAQRTDTLPGLQKELQAMLTDSVAQSSPGAAGTHGLQPTPALPGTLSALAVQHTFAEHAQDLRVCILAELPRVPTLTAVRIAFVANHDGSTSAVHITPDTAELRHCLTEKLHSYRFPAFRSGRQLASYVVTLRPSAATSDPTSGTPTDTSETFWTLSQTRAAGRTKIPSAPPWWLNQNPLYLSVDPPARAVRSAAAAAASQAHEAEARRVVPGPAPAANAATPQPPSTPSDARPADPARTPADDKWWLPAQH